MSGNKKTVDARYPLRLPSELYAEIGRLADSDNRSVNAEIVTLLQEAIALRRTLDGQRDADPTKRNPPPG